MPSSTLTSKGQLTLPKDIREFLKVKPGDRIDFVVDREGNVLVRPGALHVAELKGLLHRPRKKAVSLEEMDQAILRLHGKPQ
jgi:AbrB family looped-hinge helix DNA binding protein